MRLLIALIACGITVSAQSTQPATLAVRLPPQERLQPQRPLSVTLDVSPTRIAAESDVGFTLHVRNPGPQRVYLVPQVASNLRIFDAAGRPIEPSSIAIVNYVLMRITANKLIPLDPGQRHIFDVLPEYHPSADFSKARSYGRRGSDGRVRLQLAPGNYTARFTYIQYPDYGPWRYEITAVPTAAWEGRIETPPVSFTVLPATSVTTVATLLDRFRSSSDDRSAIIDEIDQLGGDAVPRLVELIESLDVRQREQVVLTYQFAFLARDAPRCIAVPLLLDALRYPRGDFQNILGDAFGALAPSCPALAEGLRATLRRRDASGGAGPPPSAYTQGHAAELLGRIGTSADVPILINLLRSPAPMLDRHAARAGAARGLGRIGGADAAAALVEALKDEDGNRAILYELVAEAAKLTPSGLTATYARLLAQSNASTNTLAAILRRVADQRDPALLPQVRSLLQHQDWIVRDHAVKALERYDYVDVGRDVVAAVEDPRADVQAAALFYLAKHGDASLLPTFLRLLTSSHASVALAASQGIYRFGAAETFSDVRAMLNQTSSPNAAVQRTLQLLAFRFIDFSKPAELALWWRTHANRTRFDWAREVLASINPNDAPHLALDYLGRLSNPPADLIEIAAKHPRWSVRIAAAELIGRTDRLRATALLIAELENRHLGACHQALKQLSDLTGVADSADCTSPDERRALIGRWVSRARAR